MPTTCEVSEEQRARAFHVALRNFVPTEVDFATEVLAQHAAQEAQRANERAEGLEREVAGLKMVQVLYDAMKAHDVEMRAALRAAGIPEEGCFAARVDKLRAERDQERSRLAALRSCGEDGGCGECIACSDELIGQRGDEIKKANLRAEGLAKELAEARFRPMGDNHHNAAQCPYCGDPLRAATARIAEMQDRMVAAFGEGTNETMLVAISHEHEARVAELEKQLAAKVAERDSWWAAESAVAERERARADAATAELARLRALPEGGKPLVYLACPYTHKDRAVRVSRFNAANEAASKLMLGGAYVFSPISHTHPIAEAGGLPLGWDFWEGFDRAYIGHSKKLIVLMLEGWMESTGVRAEIVIAQEAGIPVEYIDPAEAPTAPAKALAPDPAPQATHEAEK